MLKTDRAFFFFVSSLALLAISIPLVMAYQHAAPDHIFSGLLLNPIDGWSYLAKAQQGWEGNWKITLPYTPLPSAGAYIHQYYVLLGHVARILGFSVAAVLVAARVVNTVFLLIVMWIFYNNHLAERQAHRTAFAISALALGMGWVLIFAGQVPADFWIAEAYPFLAGMTNAHFPLALGLILLLAPPGQGANVRPWIVDVLLAFVLAHVSPFGVFIAILPWAGQFAFECLAKIQKKEAPFRLTLDDPAIKRTAAVLLGGMPIVVYDLTAILSDPVLSAWNDQNITAMPDWWNLVFSFSPTALVAIFGFRKAPRPLLAWAILGVLLVFIPHPLQRRILMGLQIPLAGLAASALLVMKKTQARIFKYALFFFLLPGPILLLLSIYTGIQSRNSMMYLHQNEMAAIEWLKSETDRDALVLASPEMGLILPGLTGQRVIYGHPFETVNAEAEKAAVEAYFSGAAGPDFLYSKDVDYVFYGAREMFFGEIDDFEGLNLVFHNADVRIFQVEPGAGR